MRCLIVGGGIAGLTAARKLRSLDPSVEIVILEEEARPYYLRPGLISVLAGERGLEEITPFPPSWYESQGLVYRTGVRVVSISPGRRSVATEDGEVVGYEVLLLAVGAAPMVPSIPGSEREGVFTLRTAEDAEAILSWCGKAESAVVIGGGLLGLEAARALRVRGLEVTVVEIAPWLLPRQLDREGGRILSLVLDRRFGIRVVTGVRCEEVLGDGMVKGARLSDGRRLEAQLVLFASGIRPRVELAQGAGLRVDRGIVVDDRMRTDAPGIFACGDAAQWRGRVYGIVPAAREQAEVAAANMAGLDATYRGTVPAVRLKVAGVGLTSVGEVQPAGGPLNEARAADPERGIYRKFVWDKRGRLVGAVVLGEGAGPVEGLVKEGRPVEGILELLLAGEYGEAS